MSVCQRGFGDFPLEVEPKQNEMKSPSPRGQCGDLGWMLAEPGLGTAKATETLGRSRSNPRSDGQAK